MMTARSTRGSWRAPALVGACLLLLTVACWIEAYADVTYACEYTGSQKGYREWMGGMRTGHWSTRSAMEEVIAQEYSDELEHAWRMRVGTGMNIFGTPLVFRCGTPNWDDLGPARLNDYAGIASPVEVKHLYDTLRSGDEAEKKAAVQAARQRLIDHQEAAR